MSPDEQQEAEPPLFDRLQTFLFSDLAVRGAVVSLDNSQADLFDRHNYSPSQQKLLAEASAATVLMTSHIKFKGVLSMQAKGDAKVKMLSAESSSNQGFRGLLTGESDLSDTFQENFKDATLAITIEPEKGNRYQGIVPLEGEDLATCLSGYFRQSEQLETFFVFAFSPEKTVALMLQGLPGLTSRDDDWQRIKFLAETLSSEEMLALDHHTWLYRLFHEDEMQLFASKPVVFHCGCTRERFERALIGLGADTLQDILSTEGNIATECQFCHAEYIFDEGDVALLLRSGSDAVQH